MSDIRFSDLEPIEPGYYWLRRRPSENLNSRKAAHAPAEFVRVGEKNRALHVYMERKVLPLKHPEFVGALWSEEVGAEGARKNSLERR